MTKRPALAHFASMVSAALLFGACKVDQPPRTAIDLQLRYEGAIDCAKRGVARTKLTLTGRTNTAAHTITAELVQSAVSSSGNISLTSTTGLIMVRSLAAEPGLMPAVRAALNGTTCRVQPMPVAGG